MTITDKNIREKLSFIIGSEGLSDEEMFSVYQNLVSIFGPNMDSVTDRIVLVSKNSLEYQNFKMQHFCCGCAEFKIQTNKESIFLAIDY